MIELHLVGVGDDGSLLLDTDAGGDGRYRLVVDARLRRSVAASGPTRSGGRDRVPAGGHDEGPRLTPAQIQHHLRRGLSVDVVARLAGVDVAAVQRWAGPVGAEQHRLLQLVLDGPVQDGRRRTTGTLAAQVDEWLPDGTDGAQVRWRVARRPDGAWRVSLQVPGRERVLTASWVHDEGRTEPASARARSISFPQG